jgi:4-oxalocrotonate tautomerase
MDARTQRTGEYKMPEIYVHAVKGRTQEQKKALIKDITDAVVKNFNAAPDAVVVSIIETEAASKGKGGVLFSEMKR